MEYIYVLREDMYNEWAWECGATNLVSVSYNLDTILKDLKRCLTIEKEESKERILGEDFENQDIDTIVKNVDLKSSNSYSINIYVDKEDYDNGKESGTLVIEKMEIKH